MLVERQILLECGTDSDTKILIATLVVVYLRDDHQIMMITLLLVEGYCMVIVFRCAKQHF